jgi:hypothetical protein
VTEPLVPPGPGHVLDPAEPVTVSAAVASGAAAVLRVRLDPELGWQYLSRPPAQGEATVSMPRRQLYRADRSLATLEEWLQPGWGAVRESAGEVWALGPLSIQDEPPEEPEPPRPRPRWWRRRR